MKIVKVTYTAKAEFVAQNQANISEVMKDLQQQDHPGINYTACLGADGATFIHTAFFRSEDDQKTLNELPSFRHFQQELKLKGIDAPPKQELLNLVGASKELFS
jgi:hypothetical protein